MVTCPNCAAENQDVARFCMNCGHSLRQTCPNCGTENPVTARFCFHCGTALASPAAAPPAPTPAADRIQRHMPGDLRAKLNAARSSHAMEGERRIVTILFCDVRGSTAIAEQLDPEEWAGIMNEVFDYMIQPVYRYEGTIARLMGDAILAFFGAPIAHEDDAQRAVLAGLDIVDGFKPYREQFLRARGLDLDLRVGINTGLVVVGQVGSDLAVEYTVMGDAVNVAARMEQTALPGTVQIGGHTYRLVAPLFDVETLGGIEVKGKREPVESYRVLRRKAEPGRVRGIEGLDSPLVGRDREFQTLMDRLDALGRGQGHIVSVIGEAGLGKSRLIAEARKAVLSAPPANGVSGGGGARGPLWVEGRALSYQTTTPYAPFVDLLNHVVGLPPDAGDEARIARIKDIVRQLDPQAVDEIAPYLASMLGLAVTGDDLDRFRFLDPPMLRERVFGAVYALVELLAASRPLVLVFEDMHWADETSLNLIQRLLPLVERVPLLIIGLFRPLHLDASWRYHQSAVREYEGRYTAIVLEPLDESHARQLVRNLLHIEGLPEKVRHLILHKAEGNPFFVEEVIRTLVESRLVVRENGHWRATHEIESIALPETLAGIITARLDRLDVETKRTAQTAAVIGREFAFPLLAEVHEEPEELDTALLTLQERELIREKSRIPEHVYLFKHVLTQETAYNSLLLSRRRQLHRRVADILARAEPDRTNAIAHHYLEAGEPSLALPYLVDAADKARRAYATAEALSLYRKALEISATIADAALARKIYEGLGSVQQNAHDAFAALATYDAMLAASDRYRDVEMRVSALNKKSYVTGLMMSHQPEADTYLERAEAMAREVNDIGGLAEVSVIRCMMCTAVADFDGVLQYMGQSLALARQAGIQQHEAVSLEHIATTHTYMANFEAAAATANEALVVARSINDLEHESALQVWAFPLLDMGRGDLQAAEKIALQGLATSQHIGSLVNLVFAGCLLGDIYRMRGDAPNALAHYQIALDAAEPMGSYLPFMLVMAVSVLGSAYRDLGDRYREQAAALYERTRRLLDDPASTPGGALAWAELGAAALADGDVGAAEGYFTSGLTVRSILMILQRPRHLIGMAQVRLAQGRADEAGALIDEARALVDSRHLRFYEPLVAYGEGLLAAARGDHVGALDAYRRLESMAESMGMQPAVWRAQAAAAGALDALGRGAEAEAQRSAARVVVENLIALYSDAGMRESYLEAARRHIAVPGPAAVA